MKIRGMEGSPQEIHDLFKNNGVDLSDYISAPMKTRWLVAPIVVSLVVLAVVVVGQVVFSGFSQKCMAVSVVLQLCCLVWLVSVVQVKYESVATTLVVAVAVLLLIAVVAGMMSIPDALKFLKDMKSAS
ncbi:hypothetical protein OLM90_05450 [Pseudomonas aeruginosa]|uniref:hypothetical protein n=1 Tax=Pseudomonas aeruginosa TaxID=287 RepID=UPI000985C0B4|nr:hypothetical protein [Pseudomonas aeruginosa]MCV3971530.1 hypothetical protein [Pseudomonas aeruginosa]MDI2514747.1 hypothetical protein [Pseudomonas aeruginosa]MDI2526780.1 hypothetical protein [Pseudomonas aeruginosa]MDI3909495.1 hypothetical protein [Pseudomonas aeruginosa]MDT0993085.1 hypothetical protein [Pseudomonas aeruginosa]